MPAPYFIPVPGGVAAAWTYGSGPPLALVHGGTGTGHFDWEFVIEPLSRRRTVIVLDMQAHGQSRSENGRIGVVRYGLDTALVLHRMGFPRFSAMGFSMGANSLIHLASSQPTRIEALVTIGASVESDPTRVDEILSGPWPRHLRELVHPAHPSADHWEWLRARLATDWADNVTFTPDQLRRIEAPVLALHGAEDRLVDVRQSELLCARVGAGQLVLIDGAGHAAQRDRPADVSRVVTEFLADRS